MRVMGHNVLAIVLAAVVIYVLEFVIFAMMISRENYLAMSGYSAAGMDASAARMAIGIVPPVLAAVGLSLAIKWRNKAGWLSGAFTGVMMAIFFGVAVSLYGYVYGPNTLTFVAVNLGHFVACYGVAGAILGAWR
jgi:hypothetical protein